MEPSATCVRRQRATFARRRATLGTDAFSRLLGADTLTSLIETEMPGHRERTYPPKLTLSMFVSQVLADDGSCQRVVDEHLIRSIDEGAAVPSSSTAAYCRARARLPVSLIAALCREVGAETAADAERHWRWCGRRTLLVDGTTVSMPDTPSNQQLFPQPASQEPGVGFPLARVVVLGCLSTGALLDAALSSSKGPGSDEPGRFRALMGRLEAGDVVLGDAAFESYWALAELIERGVDAVFEIRAKRPCSGRTTPVTLNKPKAGHRPRWMSLERYRQVPSTLRLRQVRVRGKEGAKGKTLLTTMTDARAVPGREIGRLYRRRWEIELDLRAIKQNLGMEILRCTDATMVARELWVYLLAYNLIRAMMVQAARCHEREPRSLSFRHAQQLWCAWCGRGVNLSEAGLIELHRALVRIRTGHRPGRAEPRAVKRRPRAQRLLQTPRAQARRERARYERR